MYDDTCFTIREDNKTTRYFVVLPRSDRPDELVETTETIYWLFKSFQREDWRQERAARHYLEKLSLSDEELEDRMGIYVPGPEELLSQSLLTDALRRAISMLPVVQARRFLLHHGLDLTYRRIAEMEHCSDVAVKRSVYLAKQKLRKILQRIF